MALVPAAAAASKPDRQSVHSFGSLLRALEGHNGQLIPEAEAFLVQNAARIERCYDLFGAGAAAAAGKTAKGKEKEKDEGELVQAIVQRLNIDEDNAQLLLAGLKKHTDGQFGSSSSSKIKDKDNDAFWEAATAFFFEERLAVLHVLAHILRSVDLEDEPPQDTYLGIASSVSQPAFAKALLDRVGHLASTSIPATSRPFTAFWARQYAKEQKALLELFFLLHYNKILPSGSTLLGVLELAKDTEWGLKQAAETEGYFDAEAYAQIPSITCLMILSCLECLNLERAAAASHTELAIAPAGSGSSPDKDSLMHPEMLSKIHALVLELVSTQPNQSGPLLLSWAFVLSRITESMTSVQLPEAYYQVAAEILPSDMHPKRNTGQPSANTSKQPVYQILASHALSPQVELLQSFQALLSSQLLMGSSRRTLAAGSAVHSDPNVPGYLSVARSLLSVLPLLIHPSYLPPSDLDALVHAMEALYANPAASLLRGQFWGLFEQEGGEDSARGEWEVVEVVQSRFPTELEQFFRLMSALSGRAVLHSSAEADEGERELAQRCAAKVKEYMSSLPSLTQVLPAMSPVVPLPYEASDAGEPLDVVSTRAIPVSPSVRVPAGCPGRFVSEQDRRPIIVAWDVASTREMGYSAWLVAGDVLKQFVAGSNAGRKRSHADSTSNALDVFTGGSGEAAPPFTYESEEAQSRVVATILELLSSMLANGTDDALETLSLLSSAPPADTVNVILATLEKASTLQPLPESITVPCTEILRALTHPAPAQIWSFIRGSGVLVPLAQKGQAAPIWGSRHSHSSPRSFLAQNKQAGTYAQTLATLSFIEGLVQQARSGSLLDAPAVSRTKSEVLLRAVQWCAESVWTGFGSWKYAHIEHKYELVVRLVGIFASCLEDADCAARCEGTRASRELLLGHFLLNGSAAHLVPLFQYIAVPNSRRTSDETIAALAERSTAAVLKLLVRLLSLSRAVMPGQPSTLERVCFSHPHSGAYASILPIDTVSVLFQLLQGDVAPTTAVAAAQALTQLCALSADWEAGPECPSLLSHLGGVKNTQRTVEALLAIAGDPFVDDALQTAVWDLLIGIMHSQPGLADVLIAGQNGLVQLAASTSSSEVDGETGVSLAVQVLTGWKEAWELQPAVLAAALSFLCAAWEGYIDSNKRLKPVRKDSKIWSAVGDILVAPLPQAPAPLELEDIDAAEDVAAQVVNDCYRRSAKAGAARLAALDAQYAISASTEGKPVSDTSVKCLSDIVASSDKFLQSIKEALSVDFDPELVSTTQQVFSDNFRKVHLEAYQLARSSERRTKYGSDFFYSSPLLEQHIRGLASEVSESAASNAVTRIEVLNLSMSRLDASSSLLGAWCDLLDVALAQVAESKAVGDTVWKAVLAVGDEASLERRSGAIMEELYDQRLKLLRTLLEYGSRRSVSPGPTDLGTAVEQLRKILSSDSMDILQSVKDASFPFHRSAMQAAYLVFYKLAMVESKSTNVPRGQHAALLSDTEASLGVCFAVIRALVSSAVQNDARAAIAADDLSLAISVTLQLLVAPVTPRPSVWLAHCHSLDLFRVLCDFLSSAPASSPAYQRMVRSLYELCTALSSVPQAAEKLALEGLVTAVNNNSLTQALEEGSVRPPSAAGTAGGMQVAENEGQEQATWCNMLSCMTQLITQLGSSVPFMDNEVVAFSKLYSRQITRAYRWSATSDALTMATLTELQNVTTLLNSVVSGNSDSAAFQPLLRKQINGSLALLQQLVYLLQHPNLLSTMLEPLSAEERSWIASEASETADLVLSDLHKRPVAAALLQAIFKLTHVIIMSLVRYTCAFTILAKDTFDWPKDRAVVSPNANVSLDEPATLGTLFDLARFCTDAARYCSSSTSHSTSSTPPVPLSAYDSGSFVELANFTLECTLLLMTTQIALAVQQQDATGSETRAAQRARRDLKELAADLVEEFLDKSGAAGAGASASDSKLLDAMRTFMLRL